MNLAYDVTRCLGQHNSALDCERKDQCERYLQRSMRGERTPVSWAVCPERSGAYPFQIRPAADAPASATLTPAQVAQMEEARAASDRLTLTVRGEVG